MSPEQVKAEVMTEALGALSWMDGYTDTWPDGAQRRVTTIAEDDSGVTKCFEVSDYHPLINDDKPRLFRITVQVEEIS